MGAEIVQASSEAPALDLDSLSAALAACRDPEQLREIRDKAIGIESYLRARGTGVDGLVDASEVVVRAERRLGEILREAPKHPGSRNSGDAETEPPETPKKLSDLGVTKKQSKRWQDLAKIPEADFEAALADARERQRRVTGAALLKAKGDEGDEHEATGWLDDLLHEHGWTLTGAARAQVLAKWDEAGEPAAYALLKAIAWSQWHTRPELARRMAELADLAPGMTVLEPSAGTGVLCQAIHEVAPDALITAIEIDEDRHVDLRGLLGQGVIDTLVNDDFLTRPTEDHFDAVVSNTPYENGTDGLFLEQEMLVADRIVALLRTNALHGTERLERVWKQCKPGGPWGLHDLVYLAARPDFESVIAEGSARSDFVVVRIDRGHQGATRVDWW